MTQQQRMMLRMAMAIHEALHSEAVINTSIALPKASWQQVECLIRRRHKASERIWTLAADRLNRDLRAAVERLRLEVAGIENQLRPVHHTACTPSVGDIYADLLSLQDEFEDVVLHLPTRALSVTTESIILDGIDLGPFEIRLAWNEGSADPLFRYRVIAVDPYSAAANEGVTHPHVQDDTLCEGDGQQPIRHVLEQGRLLDFFLIVANLLRTYNSSSPFVPLSDWQGVECSDCGTVVSSEERWFCEQCETAVCNECYYCCSGCNENFCYECVTRCEGCDEHLCKCCLKSCSDCGAELCESCLENKERCSDCHEQQWEADAKEMEQGHSGPEGKTTLRFSPTAWAKLLFLRDYGNTEVGGFGIAASDDLLFVEDIELVKQVGSWAHVAFDDESVADFFDRQVDAGRRPEQFARIWVHTHPGDSPQPSLVDEETFQRVFGSSDWALMFILACEGQSYARLRFNVGPSAEIVIPVEVDYARPFGACEQDCWEAEYLANVELDKPARDKEAELEPTLGLPCDEQSMGNWYESWFDYLGEEEHVEDFHS